MSINIGVDEYTRVHSQNGILNKSMGMKKTITTCKNVDELYTKYYEGK